MGYGGNLAISVIVGQASNTLTEVSAEKSEIHGTRYRLAKKTNGYLLEGSGRLNFQRDVPICNLVLLASGPFFNKAWYIIQDSFVLNEDGETYLFCPSEKGWILTYHGGSFELSGSKAVMGLIYGELSIKNILSEKENETETKMRKASKNKLDFPSNLPNRIILFLSKNEKRCLQQLIEQGEMTSSQIVLKGGYLFLTHLIEKGIVVTKKQKVGKWNCKIWKMNLKEEELEIVAKLLAEDELSYNRIVSQCGDEFVAKLYEARIINFDEEHIDEENGRVFPSDAFSS